MNRRPHLTRYAALLTAASALTASCGLGGGSPGEGNLLEDLRESGTMRVSNTQANPPYSFVDDSGDLVGFDVDVAEEIAQRLGIDDVEFVVGSFETFIPGLQSDNWDAVVSGLTITEERQEQIAFSCPYQVNDVAIFVPPGTEGIDEEADLSGRKVAVTAGGTQEELAESIEGTSVQTYSNSTLALRDVATGRADAYIGSKFTGAFLAEQNDLDVAPAEGYLSRESNGMAFPKGQDEIVDAANEALAEMIEDGTLSEISREWLGGLDVAEDLDPSC
jgi:cystine transport system substrate-binding protein